ncbi:hypothetical protein ACHWQZ_G011976 [Mnemiopsis leidyi]
MQSVTYNMLAGITMKLRVLLAISNLHQACWNYCEIESSTCNQIVTLHQACWNNCEIQSSTCNQ